MPWRRKEEWRYSSTILDLCTRWRWVVGFSPRPLYPRGNGPRYPLDRRLGGPQSLSGPCGEEKNLAPAGIQTLAVHSIARLYTDWAIPTHIKEKIILKWFLQKYDMRMWTGFNCSGYDSVYISYETQSWILGFHKRRELLTSYTTITFQERFYHLKLL
jgi:hypothetical protein